MMGHLTVVMNVYSDRDVHWRNLDENQNQQEGMLKMVYTVLFFGMNTECGKFPSTFKIDKERNKQQVD